MAKPIEPTPTLSGKDAENLIKEINNPTYNESKAVFLDKCKEAYNKTNNKF